MTVVGTGDKKRSGPVCREVQSILGGELHDMKGKVRNMAKEIVKIVKSSLFNLLLPIEYFSE